MTDLEMVIEGPQADVAVGEVLTRGLMEVRVDQVDSQRFEPGGVAVNLQIIAIAGGAVTIADKLQSWSKKWRKAGRGEAPLEMLVRAGGTQLRIDALSTRELAALLQQLPERSKR